MSSHRVNPGDVLGGKYEVLRVLGAGGMGVVVAARHIDLGQTVALKFMLKEAMSDPAQAERFLREAKAAVQLKSAHTARVLDVGRLDDDEPYMVMEYLEGRDLDAELRARGRLPLPIAIDFILQACEALAEAHGLGLIHRDVKLKNLFLTQTVDGRPLVKVLDFGLAKTLGPTNDVSLTATNSVFGSPQYMSPEQMRSAKDVDIRSDIWSMGVCLFELLTGRVPFDATGVAEICAMVLKDPPPRPTLFAHLPLEVENVILKCLEKPLHLRYQTFGELAVALQPYAPDQGSARRILNVISASKKTDVPTLVAGPNGSAGFTSAHAPTVGAATGGGKTMTAWDSAVPTTGRFRISRAQWIAAMTFCMTLATVGVLAIGFVKSGGRLPALGKQVASSEPTFTPPPVAVDPPSTSPSPGTPTPVSSTAQATPPSANGDQAEPPAPPSAPAAADTASVTSKVKARPGTAAPARPPTPLAPPGVKPAAAPPSPATSAAKPAGQKPKGPGSGAEYM